MLVASVGAMAGLAMVTYISLWVLGDAAPYLVISMGAAAVLMFTAPQSPLSQPWPVIGGHIIPACIGVACAQWLSDPVIGAVLALGLSLLFMQWFHCLHPPGGAVAILPVLGGDQIHALGFSFVLMPVALNSVLMVIVVMLVMRCVPGRRYPTVAATPELQKASSVVEPQFQREDLVQALSQIDEFIDVSGEELSRIYSYAVLASKQRKMGEVKCVDIMTYPVLTAEFGTELGEAWALMHHNKIKSLPVVDRAMRVIGIVTVADFIKEAHAHDQGDDIASRLRALLRRNTSLVSDKVEVVGQIMSTNVVSVPEQEHVVSLVSLFSEHAIHHVPVLNDERRLVGMVTRYDLMQVLQ